MANNSMITTFDNPYDPFEEYELWYQFDTIQGYNTCGKVAAFVHSTYDMSEAIEDESFEQGYNDLLESDKLGIYLKVTKGCKYLKDLKINGPSQILLE